MWCAILPLPVDRRVVTEEFPHYSGSSVRCDTDLLDVLRGLFIVDHGVNEQARVGLDGRQQVVELVRRLPY